jgi:hypothetical protein
VHRTFHSAREGTSACERRQHRTHHTRTEERESKKLTIDVLLGELVAGGVEPLLLFPFFLFSSLYKCKPLTLVEKDAQMSGLNLLYYTCRQKMVRRAQAYIHVEGCQGCCFVLHVEGC